MGHARYSWQKVCISALRESDPRRLLARVEQATIVLEKRAAEWGTRPGTSVELKEIRKAITTLRKLLKARTAAIASPERAQRKSR
jgi:hypothetical protein